MVLRGRKAGRAVGKRRGPRPKRERKAGVFAAFLAAVVVTLLLPLMFASAATATGELQLTVNGTPSQLIVGDVLSLTARVTNNDPLRAGTAGHVNFNPVIDPFQDAPTLQGSGCQNFIALSCPISGDLAPGQPREVQITSSLPAVGPYAIDVGANADVLGEELAAPLTALVVRYETTVEAKADTKLDLTASAASVASGAPVVVRGLVTNTKTDGTAYGAAVKFSVPPGVEVLSKPADCTGNNLNLVCPVGDLGPLLTAQRELTLRSTTEGSFAVLGTVTWARPDTTPIDTHGQVTIAVTGLDTSAPDITVSMPADGGRYAQGQVVLADYACGDEDGPEDVKTCSGTVGNGAPIDTSTPGAKSFTVTATDHAGNPNTKTVTYTVDAGPPPPVFPPPPLGFGGREGVTINNAADYTNNPNVTLTVRAPSGATQLLISNDGGFGGATTLPLSASGQYPWQLRSSGNERLPKVVYVRFVGGLGIDAKTFTDDVILDQSPPLVIAATVARNPGASAAARRRVTVRVRASDNLSGIAGVQITSRQSKPGKALGAAKRFARSRTLAQSFSVNATTRRLWVRAIDRAGNPSAWRPAR